MSRGQRLLTVLLLVTGAYFLALFAVAAIERPGASWLALYWHLIGGVVAITFAVAIVSDAITKAGATK